MQYHDEPYILKIEAGVFGLFEDGELNRNGCSSN